MVHIGAAVRIDTREQGYDRREVGEVIPAEPDAGGSRHGNEVHGMVGRASGRQQANNGVDKAAHQSAARRVPDRGGSQTDTRI